MSVPEPNYERLYVSHLTQVLPDTGLARHKSHSTQVSSDIRGMKDGLDGQADTEARDTNLN